MINTRKGKCRSEKKKRREKEGELERREVAEFYSMSINVFPQPALGKVVKLIHTRKGK